MSQSFEIQGIIHSIGETTEYGSNGFTKREFVIKLNGQDENPAYPNYIALELIKDKCAIMDSRKIGDEIKVTFNLSGRLWQAAGKPEKCFTSLQAWKIESGSGSQQESDPMAEPPGGFDYNDDIPF
ncbi:DUF3127 domain-containing protein [Myxococcota bacterium]|nr:DUF3127 domain-containing protein [Myxococcota bacterium]MBU1536102.1 DUF3127 domain-containing protein [Myxococcota bacterium]